MTTITCTMVDPTSRIAAEELNHFLKLMGADGLSATLSIAGSLSDDEITIESTPHHAALSGGSPASLLHAVYTLLDRMGCVFDFSGYHVPADTAVFPAFSLRQRPRIRNRGIRMHLNFPQDQSFFTEDAFCDWIDNITRMRMNLLCFHMYTPQQWFPFSYHGVKHLDLELGYFHRSPLDPKMPGRERIAVKEHWFPAELESIRDREQVMLDVYHRLQRMMVYAKQRGMRNMISLEPESMPPSLSAILREGEQGAFADGRSIASLWQQEWSGMALDAVNTLHPLVMDIAAERALQAMDAFPDLDELQLVSCEGTQWHPGDGESYSREINRLTEKFHLPLDVFDMGGLLAIAPHDEIPEKHLRAHPYWTVLPGENYLPTVLGSLRAVELSLSVFSDPRIIHKLNVCRVTPCIAVYSPNPHTVRLMMPALAAMMPKGMRFDCLADYGARDIAANLPSWHPVCTKQSTGMISWLEFDGVMAMAQSWTGSLLYNVDKACEMGIQTMYFNHWRVRSMEHNAAAAAIACWEQNAQKGFDDYLCRLFGKSALSTAQNAYAKLQEATFYAKDHNYNLGFINDWVVNNSSDPPGYYWQYLVQSASNYRQSADAFADLAATVSSSHPLYQDAVRQARYMEMWCSISVLHIRGVYHIQNAKLPLVGYKAWPLGNTRAAWPPPPQLHMLLDEAKLALSLEEQYVEEYAKWVESCDEQGHLVVHWHGVVDAIRTIVLTLEEQIAREESSDAAKQWINI